MVTHDEKIIPTFKRLYHIRDGQTVEEAGEGLRRWSEFFSPHEHRAATKLIAAPQSPGVQRPFRLLKISLR